MPVEVKVPTLSESVADATLLSWHKREGDYVERDENLIDLETDKVILDLPAPIAGIVTRIMQPDGATVVSDQVIALIEPSDRPADAQANKPAMAAVPLAAQAYPSTAAPAAPASGASLDQLSPAVRKMVANHPVDPAAIEPTGPGGRLTKADVTAHLEARAAGAEAPVGTHIALSGERPERRVPMTRLRARIAERLTEAQNSMAMLTTFNEVSLQAVNEVRRKHQDEFVKAHGLKMGYMSFFIKAVTASLKKYPVINASIDNEDIVYHGYCDIGVAVSSDRGLVVPIIRDADTMSFAELEKAVAEYGRQARENALSIESLTGGTFTITNGGVFGSMMSTPIINPPQSAILGMHRIQERPVVENGEIVIRPMMYLALSYDHRLIDGRDAVLFLVSVKEALEDPARLLLGI